jgi:lactoylglutathione lyase/glyoxylase I family protein
MIISLAHVCFHVRDLEASVGFYRDVLGLKKAFSFDLPNGKTGVYMHVAQRSFIELFENKDLRDEAGGSFRHICLEVDGLTAFVERLVDQGVEVTQLKLGADQSWQAWLTDPDGNHVELHEYTENSMQKSCLDSPEGG